MTEAAQQRHTFYCKRCDVVKTVTCIKGAEVLSVPCPDCHKPMRSAPKTVVWGPGDQFALFDLGEIR